ncbi:hypothetical protein MRB53_041722 [Persea americana]|nr:hypothetical protein MRB53_041722 [Persea americana]
MANSLSILAKVQEEIAIENALLEVSLIWGTYSPPGASATPVSTSSGTSSGPASSSRTSPSGPSSSNGASCGPAPATVVDGFPTANCGDVNFDKLLDDALGYYDFSDAAFNATYPQFFPGISLDDPEPDIDDFGTTNDLVKRGRILNGLKAIGRGVKKVVKVVVKVATIPLRVAAATIRRIPGVGDFIVDKTSYNPERSSTNPIALGPKNEDLSPWGMATLIYSKPPSTGKTQADINLFCVNVVSKP